MEENRFFVNEQIDNFEQLIEECPICIQPIERIYAMIENTGENGKYHPECIDKWLKTSKNGILVQQDITSITIYDDEIKLCNFNIAFKENQDDMCNYTCIIL